MAIIVYAARTQLTREHHPVLIDEGIHWRDPEMIYIRAVISAGDVALAHSNARPLPGEIVLNAIPDQA